MFINSHTCYNCKACKSHCNCISVTLSPQIIVDTQSTRRNVQTCSCQTQQCILQQLCNFFAKLCIRKNWLKIVQQDVGVKLHNLSLSLNQRYGIRSRNESQMLEKIKETKLKFKTYSSPCNFIS